MKRAKTAINDRLGLHARVAYQLMKIAEGFDSSITIAGENVGHRADCKDIMDILKLGIGPGEAVIIEATGSDEGAAVDSLVEYLGSAEGQVG